MLDGKVGGPLSGMLVGKGGGPLRVVLVGKVGRPQSAILVGKLNGKSVNSLTMFRMNMLLFSFFFRKHKLEFYRANNGFP